MSKEEIIDFWVKSSDRDYVAMKHLLEKKDYTWSLFIGHLVLEKLLKAYYVKAKDRQIPYIHNLDRIAKLSDLHIDKQMKEDFMVINSFNLNTHYPEYKVNFHKASSKEFASNWIEKIKEIRKWIKQKL